MLFCFRRKAFRKQKINFVNGVSEATSQVTGATTERSQESWRKRSLANGFGIMVLGVVCGLITKRIHHTWKVVKGMRLLNSDLIYDSNLQLYGKVCNRLRHLHRSGTLEMFLVSLLYDRICLRIDVFKINYWLNIRFIIWFLYVFYSITFVLWNTDPRQHV